MCIRDSKEALVLFGVLALCSFCLILPFQSLSMIGLSVIALFLAASYPFTKRFFAVPQAYLGVAFGFGIPMAYVAHLDTIPRVAWWLLLANVFWAMAYDTEYAMVDRADDLKIGIRTSAITFGPVSYTHLDVYKRQGVQRIASETPVPIIPMALYGLWGSFFSRKHGPAMSRPSCIRLFRKIGLVAGPAVPPERSDPAYLQGVVSALGDKGA